jgi:hypothetical protein
MNQVNQQNHIAEDIHSTMKYCYLVFISQDFVFSL